VSLTATAPDQELLDGLSLDAAWERASALESERDAALTNLQYTKNRYETAQSSLVKMTMAIYALIQDGWGAGPEVQAVLTELEKILRDASRG
jgi:hypothetical protein